MGDRVQADTPFPPSVEDFFLPSIAFGPWVTKFSLLVWLAVAAVIVFFLVSYRNPKLVPTKRQWLAESTYGFIRDGVAREVIGRDGLRFAPYLTALFLFIFMANIFGVIPLAQISPMSHIAYPIVLALSTYVLYLYLGIKKRGLGGYLKDRLFPPGAPWPLYVLLTPIEFTQYFITQPLTLSVRLFANMFRS